MTITSWGDTEREVVVDSGPASYLIVHESANPGWKATLDGEELPAVTIDGWQQGYLLPAGSGGTVELVYVPTSTYRASILLGGALVILLLGLALVPGREPFPPPVGARRLHPGVLWAVAAVAMFLVGGIGGLAMLGLVWAVRFRWPHAPPLLAGGAFAAASLLVAVTQTAFPDDLRGAFGVPATVLSLLAIAAVAAALLPLPVRFRRDDEEAVRSARGDRRRHRARDQRVTGWLRRCSARPRSAIGAAARAKDVGGAPLLGVPRWCWLAATLAGLVLVGPGLAPGAWLNLDLVVLADNPLPRGAWGLGPELPRRVPLWIPIAWLSALGHGERRRSGPSSSAASSPPAAAPIRLAGPPRPDRRDRRRPLWPRALPDHPHRRRALDGRVGDGGAPVGGEGPRPSGPVAPASALVVGGARGGGRVRRRPRRALPVRRPHRRPPGRAGPRRSPAAGGCRRLPGRAAPGGWCRCVVVGPTPVHGPCRTPARSRRRSAGLGDMGRIGCRPRLLEPAVPDRQGCRRCSRPWSVSWW